MTSLPPSTVRGKRRRYRLSGPPPGAPFWETAPEAAEDDDPWQTLRACPRSHMLGTHRLDGRFCDWPIFCESWSCSRCGLLRARYWLWRLAQLLVKPAWVATAPGDEQTRDRISKRAERCAAQCPGVWTLVVKRKDQPEVLVVSNRDLSARRRGRGIPPSGGQWLAPLGAMIMARGWLRCPGVDRVRLFGDGVPMPVEDAGQSLYLPVDFIPRGEAGEKLAKHAAELAAQMAAERFGVAVAFYDYLPGHVRVSREFVPTWRALVQEALAALRREPAAGLSEFHLSGSTRIEGGAGPAPVTGNVVVAPN